LQFLRARYYDSGTGRFLSKDSWQGDYTRPQSLDAWGYVEGDPVNQIDPSGQQCNSCGDTIPLPPPDCIPSPPFGYCVEGNEILTTFEETILRPSVKQSARQFCVPWQVVGGVLESERTADFDLGPELREALIAMLGPKAAFLVTRDPSNPASGYANIHVPTTRHTAEYFQNNYLLCIKMQLDISTGDSDEAIVTKLQNLDFSIRTEAAIVRHLADFRFGSNGLPHLTNHANLADWTIADAVAIWHGYRYGAPVASPPGQGLGFANIGAFQDRTKSLSELINNVVIGQGDPKSSAAMSIPIFQKYFGLPDN
jgi:hypothetical protein